MAEHRPPTEVLDRVRRNKPADLPFLVTPEGGIEEGSSRVIAYRNGWAVLSRRWVASHASKPFSIRKRELVTMLEQWLAGPPR